MAIEPKKHAMPAQEPIIREKNFKEVALGYTAEIAKAEANRCLCCKNKPCVSGCPVNIDIPDFIAQIKKGDYEAAYSVISDSSSLPAVCGRVCPQESQCEKHCTLGIKFEPVAIGRLERFVADWHNEHSKKTPVKPESNGLKVAVIGSGPSGLAQRTLHGKAALGLRKARAGIGDLLAPVRDLAARDRVDAEAVTAILFRVPADDPGHIINPCRPQEVKAPVVERRAVFLVGEPFGMGLCARVRIAATVRHAILPDLHAEVVRLGDEALVVFRRADAFLKLVVVAWPVNGLVLQWLEPDRIAAEFANARQILRRERKTAPVAAERTRCAARMH